MTVNSDANIKYQKQTTSIYLMRVVSILLLTVVLSSFSIPQNQIDKSMGISINLYRINKAERLADISNLETELSKTKDSKLDLYKMTSDLAIIFLDNPNPFFDTSTIPYKMLFGKQEHGSVSFGEIGGFLPASEVQQIIDWINRNKLEAPEGFAKMYTNLSGESKKALEDIGSPGMDELYKAYVKPMITFYKQALENNNAIVFIGA